MQDPRSPAGEALGTAAVVPHRTVLPNGLEVIVLENHVVPLEIDVHNGAYTETADYDGLSHLYEHMFFKANQRIPDQESYLRRTRELGMEWNGTTSEERVNYYFTLQSRDLTAGLGFLCDALRTPLFLPAELEREREVVLGEYDRAEADPGFHLHVAIAKRLWHTYYTRKNVIGTREVIQAALPAQMLDIQRRFYLPNNSALLIAGDVEPARAVEQAAEIFGDWPAGPDPFAAEPIPHHPPLRGSSGCVVEKPVGTVSLVLSWHGPSVELDRAGTLAADVLTFILGQRNSRFYRRLVDSGLASSAALHYQTLRYTGPLQAMAVAAPEQAAAALAMLREEVASLGDPSAFTDEELENAKRQLEIDQIYEAERPSQLVHALGYWWAVAGLDYYTGYAAALRAVTRADVHALARRYIVDRPCVTGIMLAPKHRELLGDALREVS
jgi:zinc protease